MTFHIIPKNDDQEHTFESTCKCSPRFSLEEGLMFYAHNSADGREGLEEAMEILFGSEKAIEGKEWDSWILYPDGSRELCIDYLDRIIKDNNTTSLDN